MHTQVAETLKLVLIAGCIIESAFTQNFATLDYCPEPGWFGIHCKMKCRCRGGESSGCNRRTGQCEDGGCLLGWFGPGCQYRAANTSLPHWATDSNLTTCNNEFNLSITARLTTPIYLTWLLLEGKHHEIENIQVYYSTLRSPEENKTCPHLDYHKATKAIQGKGLQREVLCPVREEITAITLEGTGVLGLCSVSISMGRSLALMKNVYETGVSNFSAPPWKTQNIADGILWTDNGTDWGQRHLCTDPSTSSLDSQLTFVFISPMEITAVVLYLHATKNVENKENLTGFEISLLDERFQKLYEHKVRGPSPYTPYMVIPPPDIADTLHALTITNSPDSNMNLALCEVEAYGDCGGATYGLECANECNCENVSSCAPSGACLFECPPGFKEPPSCEKLCDGNFYGPMCKVPCSPFCESGICTPKTGSCVYGCKYDFLPPNCNLGSLHTTAESRARLSENTQIPDGPEGTGMEEWKTGSIIGTFIAIVILVVAALVLTSIGHGPTLPMFQTLYKSKTELERGKQCAVVRASRSASWGSNICDTGNDIQSISTPHSTQCIHSRASRTPEEFTYDIYADGESKV